MHVTALNGMSSPVRLVRRLLAERLSPDLRREASEDPVTGALNRRGDNAATARALRERRPGTCLLRLRADLDNFKVVNDVYGHATGDAVLWMVRDGLERATRDIDVLSLARPGGDEFALTLRVDCGADTEAIRNRIEGAVNDELAEAGFGSAAGRQIGISIGIAAATDWTSFEALDRAADAAAHERKRARGLSRPRAATRPNRLVSSSVSASYP